MPRKSRTTPGASHAGSGSTITTEASSPSESQLLPMLEMMLLIRRFEERAARIYIEARIGGYCHLNLGEEATVVGLADAMDPDDYLFTNYREHGYALARGISPGRIMAELYGKQEAFLLSTGYWLSAVRANFFVWPVGILVAGGCLAAVMDSFLAGRRRPGRLLTAAAVAALQIGAAALIRQPGTMGSGILPQRRPAHRSSRRPGSQRRVRGSARAPAS